MLGITSNEISIFNDTKIEQSTETADYWSKTEIILSKQVTDKIKINDRLVRIIGVQFFGIVIPNATGLVSNTDQSALFIVGAYAYFMLISFLIWQGNRYILFKLEEQYNWFINPAQKVVLILGANVFYTAPLVVVMLLFWYHINGNTANWNVIQATAIVCVICVIFITHVYETIFLIKQRESDILKGERLEKSKVKAELDALKNQIDPHFMFNSLNSLSYLIDQDPKKAKDFTSSLADIYRYILSNKDTRLVLLEDELAFLNKYISLLKLRFGDTLNVSNTISKTMGNNYLIPPISIFMALENVVKHNEISKKHPMEVLINLSDSNLSITNNIRKKKSMEVSSKIGLNNLDERYKIIVGEGIKTNLDEKQFNILLPMLEING
ncbi:MAG TPA: histidine kinase [Fulvivirga sp.]|nr:histidine kinase [Fulvivirga sp.]